LYEVIKCSKALPNENMTVRHMYYLKYIMNPFWLKLLNFYYLVEYNTHSALQVEYNTHSALQVEYNTHSALQTE